MITVGETVLLATKHQRQYKAVFSSHQKYKFG